MAGTKVPTTLTIDSEVKMDFKLECVKNGVEMSETVEHMMLDYVKVSREIHLINKNKVNGE